jgi:SAM-dependent methyltransferase
MRAYRKLLHAVDNHGARGLLLRALRKLARKPDPGPEFHEADTPHPFDKLHATDTSGHIPGEELGANTPSDLYNTAYYGISPSSLTGALELLPEPADGFTFVDLGCGKGRALLVAARFPFAHILGIELSANLCAVARSNAAREPRIAIQQHDAATVTYPDGPLVVYLYHPFLRPVLRKVLANLERQRRRSAHPTYLLYANCRYEKVMARFPFLKAVWDYSIPLSPEDAAADRHGTTQERYTLYKSS